MVQNKKVKETKKRNVVDLEHVMSRPKTTKKRKSSINMDYGTGPSSRAVCHDDKLSQTIYDF